MNYTKEQQDLWHNGDIDEILAYCAKSNGHKKITISILLEDSDNKEREETRCQLLTSTISAKPPGVDLTSSLLRSMFEQMFIRSTDIANQGLTPLEVNATHTEA